MDSWMAFRLLMSISFEYALSRIGIGGGRASGRELRLSWAEVGGCHWRWKATSLFVKRTYD